MFHRINFQLNFLTPNGKEHAVACVGEFIGSFIFLMFGSLIMQESATIGDNEHMVVIMGSFGFGFGMMVSIYMFNDVSGVHLTPPITIAQTLVGNSPLIRMFLFIPMQLVSGIAAAYVVGALTPGPAAFAPHLAEHVTISQGFFIELFGSTIINLSVLFITQHTKGVTPAVVIIAPCIGISGFVGHLFSIYYTGGSLNPARALGACLAHGDKFPHGFWLYIVAPLCSGVLSALIFSIVLKLEETMDFNKRRKKELAKRRKREGV